MKLIDKMREVDMLRERANEIHEHCERLRDQGVTSVALSKEMSTFQGILEDTRNIYCTLTKRRRPLAVWFAVTVARMSLETYLETYQDY